jgi:glycosyltransferase involved in cell wall biosynthesis
VRVAVNGKPFASAERGGAIRVAWNLVTHLAQDGLLLDLFVPAPPNVELSGPIPENVTIHYSRSPLYGSGVGRSLWEQTILPRAVRRSGPYAALLNLTNSAPVLLELGTPQLLLLHDVGFLNRDWFQGVFSAYLGWIARRAQRRLVRVVTVSRSSAAQIEAAFPGLGPVRVIHNGSDLPLGPIHPANLGYRYVLFVGSMNPRKNLRGAIDGFSLFRSAVDEDVRLVIVGLTKPIFAQSDAAGIVPDGVVVRGYVTEEEKWALLKGAEALLLPSFLEGFGLPVLEALQVGTPAVVSDLPVFRELYDGAVVYADPRSAGSIGDALLRIWRDPPLRATLVREGAGIAARHRWVNAVRGYRALLDEMMRAGSVA